MQITAFKTPLFEENQSLIDFIKENTPKLVDGDVLAITSKLVALSEGRIGKIEDREKIIHTESTKVIETPWAFLTLTQRGWEINAGIDESNVEGGVTLMPRDAFLTAETIWNELKKFYNLENLGIIITDTKSVPLRVGTIGRTISCAGFLPTKSYIGKEDLYGRKSRVTISNVADSLSAVAVLMMGEGDEQSPLVIIKGAPVNFINRNLSEAEKKMYMLPEQDIFSYIYKE
jgi:coenzyme F420-0:L-glutamate ligase